MNYIELFAKGGLTKSEKSEGEQRAIQLLESLQELTGVNPKQAAEILNQFKDDPETVNSIQEYVNLAIDPQSDENIRSNAISELTKIFNPNMESQIFKCGGKLQQLVTKFGKGGGIDCGCGGTKLQEGGRTISADGSITIVNPNTAQADTLGRYSYPSTNGKFQLLSNGERNATVWDNTGGFPIARYANETFMQNHPVRTFLGGYKKAPAGYFENIVDRVNNRFDQNGVPIKQEGGELTRSRARRLAVTNKGYNNAQFNTAFANAMNALRRDGLRGKDLRARALAMASGYSDQTPTVETPAKQGAIDFGYIDELVGNRPTKEQLITPIFAVEETPIITRPIVRNASPSRTESSSRTVSPSRVYTPNLNVRSTGSNPLDEQYDAANRMADERINAWQETQLRSRNMYFPRIDSSLEEEVIIPANTAAQGTGVLMPLTGNEARMAQTMYGVSPKPVTKTVNDIVVSPVSRKQGGQIEKDITKTLKCGGKTKKKK